MSHRVEVCSPAEAQRIIREMRETAIRFELHGHVALTAREVESNDIAWQLEQSNLITDYGRRNWTIGNFSPNYIFTSPSTDPATLARYALFDDGNASSSQTSGSTTPTWDGVTLTKTWSPSAFAAPAANRQIGTVGLANAAHDTNGILSICAFTVLSPVKTQTTTQTLEIVYKVTLTPVY